MRDGETPLSQDFFNKVFADIDTRIAELEARRADWNEVLASLTTFGLQRIDVLVGPAMAEVNAMLADLRTKRDQLVAAIGNISNLVTQAELGTALETLAGSITKEGIGLGQVDNVSAAALRDRTTHTGTQGMATVNGLADALAAKVTALLDGGTIAAATAAQAGYSYDADTSAAAFTVTFPAEPQTGNRIGLNDAAWTWAQRPLTVNGNGKRIEGQTGTLILDRPMRAVWVFKNEARGWVIESKT